MTYPDDLRQYLGRKLTAERTTMRTMDELYTASSPLAFIDPETLKALGNRVSPVPINLCRLAIDVVCARLQVSGWRSATGDVVDEMVTDLWREVGLAELSPLIMLDALIYGRGYAIAWADAAGNPTVSAESPLSMTVGRDPVSRGITSALKRWVDVEGFSRTLLLTPDTVYEFRSRNANAPDPVIRREPNPLGDDMELVREDPNALGIVPVVSLVNRPRTSIPDGESELTDLEAPVRAIAKLGSDMLVASEAAAIPRRWLTTPAMMSKEQAQDVQRTMSATMSAPAASRVAVVGGGADLREFSTSDLVNFKTAIELLVGEVAALASLPDYYVNTNSAMPASADAIRSGLERLTSKAKQRQMWWGPQFANLMRMVALIKSGQEDRQLDALQCLWVDPEPSTIAQSADAAVKLFTSKIIDRRAALESLDYSPIEVERILTETNVDPVAEPGASAAPVTDVTMA